MAGGVGHYRGGIRSLARLLREHEGAIRRDLLCVGLRLDDGGTEYLSWADLWAFCYWSPVDSALHNSLNPDHVSVETLLTRSVEHSLRWLVWAKTPDGQKGRNIPQQWPLPCDTKPSEDYEAMTPDDMDAFLGWSPRDIKGGGDDG